METNVSRRDFLKGSIVVALGAAGAATLSSCAGGDAAAKADSAVATAPDTAAKTATLHRGYGAAHGDKCFTSVVVATAEDGTILAASVDDYQFMPADSAGITPVPNSDAGFADGYAEGKVLMSKTVNNDAYSASMKEKAQSTTPWLTSMKAIEAYCVGKKASDLTKTSLDAVTGATLVDAPNYLKLVSEVAGSDAFCRVIKALGQRNGQRYADDGGAHGRFCGAFCKPGLNGFCFKGLAAFREVLGGKRP